MYLNSHNPSYSVTNFGKRYVEVFILATRFLSKCTKITIQNGTYESAQTCHIHYTNFLCYYKFIITNMMGEYLLL